MTGTEQRPAAAMRRLGRSGMAVSEIGLGLWGMGSWSGSDDETSLNVLRKSAELGCNFYDSAWAYGDGRSDLLLGQLLRRQPEHRLVAASKVPPQNLTWPASGADRFEDVFPADYVREMTDRIRRALGVDTVPLLQLHVWDDHWANDRSFRGVVEELKSSRGFENFGISLNRWEPWNGLAVIATGLVDAVQVIYNIFDQAPEDELFPACAEADVGVIARVPLDEGGLSGTFTLETRFPSGDWRSRYFGPENLPPTVERVDALKGLLPAGMSLPELAIRFILSDERVSTMIVGIRSEAHLLEDLAATARGPLPADLITALRVHCWDRVPAPWSD